MKNVLIASYDMEVGGVERSLVSMLDNFDYKSYSVDLMLYSQQGSFMNLISEKVNLLDEVPQYATFRKPISEILFEKYYCIGLARILSKINSNLIGRVKKVIEPGYYQMQLMWKYALPFLPSLEKEYDVAISYLWPHYFVADKIKAKKKIAWIHTDYSNIKTNINLDLKMWGKFDYIIAVSESCKKTFLTKYRGLENKVIVIENLTSPEFIKVMSEEKINNPMNFDNNFKIISVARLSHAKGIDQAVKAMKILKDKGYRNITWYVVGYGGDEPLIRDLIFELDLEENFILLGKKENPYPYIKKADLYVQPSRYEGKAVTVTEAKILGKPILITNYSTAKSQIQDLHDGCITELSVGGIAEGVEKLYLNSELRKRISSNCLNTSYENYFELEKLYKII